MAQNFNVETKKKDDKKEDKLFENQQLFRTPIVRNGRQATVGYQPDVWKNWE